MNGHTLAIVGATGLVGRTALKVLEENNCSIISSKDIYSI